MRLAVCIFAFFCSVLAAQAQDRVQVRFDTSEAEAVLVIFDLEAAGKPVPEAAWQALFATEPYRRLKERETMMAKRFNRTQIALSDEDFRTFIGSEAAYRRAGALRSTLAAWKKADLAAAARRDLDYLPDGAVIRAKVFPVIKPRPNTFVFDLDTDPTIFLYLDPDVSAAKFENTVAHELHHIGLGSLGPVYDKAIAGLPDEARTAAGWMAAFGEGFAMLAAAGGPDIDPQAASPAAQRARWDRDMATFDTDLVAVNQFFLDVLHKRFANEAAIGEKAGTFYGDAQGAWYTVGYKMAVMVEKRYGRPALIATMRDPRCLLVRYNAVAAERNADGKSPLWSDEVLTAVQAGACQSAAHG